MRRGTDEIRNSKLEIRNKHEYRIIRKQRTGQRGFTLVELIAVLAISGIIGSGIAATVFQVISIGSGGNARMQAVSEVDNALHWLMRDIQMAQTINATQPSGFPLRLSWVEWSGNTNNVTYTANTSGLFRAYSASGQPATMQKLASSINLAQTSCNSTSAAFTLVMSTIVAGEIETRTVVLHPRPSR